MAESTDQLLANAGITRSQKKSHPGICRTKHAECHPAFKLDNNGLIFMEDRWIFRDEYLKDGALAFRISD